MVAKASRKVLDIRVKWRQQLYFFLHFINHLDFFEWWVGCEVVEGEWKVMMSSVRGVETRYIPRRQTCRKRLLHHEKVGWPSTFDIVMGRVGGGYINGGVGGYSRWFWWALYSRVKIEEVQGSWIGAW